MLANVLFQKLFQTGCLHFITRNNETKYELV